MSAAYIANLCYERVGIVDEKMRWVRLGSLWWGGERHYATIKMDLWHEGSFIAKALRSDPPYISGDIFAIGGKELDDKTNRMVNIRHKVGHIQTSESEHGVYYSGEFLVSFPISAIMHRLKDMMIHDEPDGCFLRLRVDLDDKENE